MSELVTQALDINNKLREIARKLPDEERGTLNRAYRLLQSVASRVIDGDRKHEAELDRMARRYHVALRSKAEAVSESLDPHGFFVYCLWDRSNTCLYVGQSENVLSRLGQHMSDALKRERTSKITLQRCESRDAMMALEAHLIAAFRPPLNVALVPRLEEPACEVVT